MIRNRPIKAIVGIAGVAAVLAVFVSTGLATQASKASNTQPQLELNQANFEKRSKEASSAALANPQIKAIVDSSYNYATDAHWLEDKDTIEISTWGSQTVEGDWTIGYTINLRGGKVIEADVDRGTNAVSNVRITPRDDQSVPLAFTDNQKRAIEISLSDPQVKAFTDNNKFYVSLVRDYGNVQFANKDCGFDECAIVQFSSMAVGKGAGTIVNTKTGAIYDVQVTG